MIVFTNLDTKLSVQVGFEHFSVAIVCIKKLMSRLIFNKNIYCIVL